MPKVLSAAVLLASRMLVVAAIVVLTSVVVARSGPFLGAMAATLPVSAGPAYLFLAMDHDPSFVADSTIASILGVAASALFVVAYAHVSRVAGTLPSLAAALATFFGALLLLGRLEGSLPVATSTALAIFALAIAATRAQRRLRSPLRLPSRAADLLVRAVAVMAVVAAVTVLGQLAGPRAAGYAALTPLVFMSLIVVLQPRVGGAPVAAIMSNGLFGMLGFIPAFVVLRLALSHMDPGWALASALLVSLGWNGALVVLRRARG